MAVEFKHVSNLKKQPTADKVKAKFGGFPVPMGKQMSQPPRKLKFPKPKKR